MLDFCLVSRQANWTVHLAEGKISLSKISPQWRWLILLKLRPYRTRCQRNSFWRNLLFVGHEFSVRVAWCYAWIFSIELGMQIYTKNILYIPCSFVYNTKGIFFPCQLSRYVFMKESQKNLDTFFRHSRGLESWTSCTMARSRISIIRAQIQWWRY